MNAERDALDVSAIAFHLSEDKKGGTVRQGDVLARVGHTGISTAPHLHFHLMDSGDLLTAQGIPCAFKTYEVYDRGRWRSVDDGLPGFNERIRYIKGLQGIAGTDPGAFASDRA